MRASTTGLMLAIVSAATFGTSGTFATGLLAVGWSPGAAVAARVGIAALVLTVPGLLQVRGRWAQLRRSWAGVVAYGVVAIAGCQLFFFNAVQHLSVGVALLVEYSGTVLVVLWLWVRHGQRPRRYTVLGMVFALTGLGLVLDLTGHQHVDGAGLLWAAAAAVGLAFYFLVSARTEDTVPPLVMAWAGMSVGALVLLLLGLSRLMPMHATTSDADFAGTRTSVLVPVLGLSLVAAAAAYSLGIASARLLGARLASFVGLAEVLFAVIFAWWALGERPTLLQAVGGVVVLVGIVLVRLDDTPVQVSDGRGTAPAEVPVPAVDVVA